MTKKYIKQIALASYTKAKLDPKKVRRIVRFLTRHNLKQYITELKLLENQKIIYAVSKGTLDKEIVRYCEKNNIDLIITGHKHRNKLYSLMQQLLLILFHFCFEKKSKLIYFYKMAVIVLFISFKIAFSIFYNIF